MCTAAVDFACSCIMSASMSNFQHCHDSFESIVCFILRFHRINSNNTHFSNIHNFPIFDKTFFFTSLRLIFSSHGSFTFQIYEKKKYKKKYMSNEEMAEEYSLICNSWSSVGLILLWYTMQQNHNFTVFKPIPLLVLFLISNF